MLHPVCTSKRRLPRSVQLRHDRHAIKLPWKSWDGLEQTTVWLLDHHCGDRCAAFAALVTTLATAGFHSAPTWHRAARLCIGHCGQLQPGWPLWPRLLKQTYRYQYKTLQHDNWSVHVPADRNDDTVRGERYVLRGRGHHAVRYPSRHAGDQFLWVPPAQAHRERPQRRLGRNSSTRQHRDRLPL